MLDGLDVLVFKQFLYLYFIFLCIRIPSFCLGSIYESLHLNLYEESKGLCSFVILGFILYALDFDVLIIVFFFSGTTGIVDYTNYDDMKYAVSYLFTMVLFIYKYMI